MKKSFSLIRNKQYQINENISINIPTLGEIYDYGDNEYFRLIQLLTSTPYDLMVQFDDIGIDYETITEYQLFLMLFEGFVAQGIDLSIIFGSLDLTALQLAESKITNGIVLIDQEQNCIIDQLIQQDICDVIRKIHFLKKQDKKAGNQAAKEYLIERNRIKQRRAAKKQKQRSILDESIIHLVNTEEFKYNYEECMDLSIYKFNASLHQIQKKKDWEQTMNGVYFGTVDLSKLNIEKNHWMSSI